MSDQFDWVALHYAAEFSTVSYNATPIVYILSVFLMGLSNNITTFAQI